MVINFHAGVTKKKIIEEMNKVIKLAENNKN